MYALSFVDNVSSDTLNNLAWTGLPTLNVNSAVSGGTVFNISQNY